MPAKKRKSISTRTRFEVFKRDAFVCQYCGAHPPSVILHIDHILPVSDGGGNDRGNLITSCQQCNAGKSNVHLSAIPKPMAENAAEIAEREAQILGYAEIMREARERKLRHAWVVAEPFAAHFDPKGMAIRTDWLGSISRFVERLGVYDVLSAMDIALSRHGDDKAGCFRYFCGICWMRIRQEDDNEHQRD